MVSLWTALGLLCLVVGAEAAKRAIAPPPAATAAASAKGKNGAPREGSTLRLGNETASGCFAMTGCSDVKPMQCSADRRIFILKAQNGRKSAGSTCSTRPSCGDCCTPGDSDCFRDYSVEMFKLMYYNSTCWNGTSCWPRVQLGNESCGLSTFAGIRYSCLQGEDITDFHRNTTVIASAVAIHYNYSDVTGYPIADTDSYKTWHCQVGTADSVQRQADVILVREQHVNGHELGTSSLGWSEGVFLDHLKSFLYTSFNATLPFNLSVRVGKRWRLPDGWAVVRAQDGSNLTVTCGHGESNTSTQSPDMASASSQGLTSGPAPPAAEVNLAAVVGGVVAVVLLLVAVVLGVFFLRRWRQNPGASLNPLSKRKLSVCAPLTSVNSRRPSSSPSMDQEAVHTFGDVHPGVSNRALHLAEADVDVGGDYAVVEEQSQPQVNQYAASGAHGNPRSPVEDPDYDRLGGKKPQSSSSNPAATYGRLGEMGGGGEDTDYSYDHLSRGRQAAPDVIDSDYDTSALHVTSEGDYDVAGIPRKQHVITGSDYDTAEIGTSEGDYNRVDFQGRKNHVITGSDYDTAEIVTSEGDYNRVDFQGRKQHVITGSDYDTAESVASESVYTNVDFH